MKRHLVGAVVVAWLAMSPVVYAGVTDWPIIGQVTRVGICLIGDTGRLTGSLLAKLGEWGAELVGAIGKCSQVVVGTVTDTVVDVVSLRVPTPSAEPVHE